VFVVVVFGIVVTGFVYAAEASIEPFAREQRRLDASDRAIALAEGGLVAARAEVERGALPAISGARLGAGRVDVTATREGADVVLVATGTIDAPPLVRKGDKVARRMRARLRPRPSGGFVVIEWREP
jgi:hypothetical protein